MKEEKEALHNHSEFDGFSINEIESQFKSLSGELKSGGTNIQNLNLAKKRNLTDNSSYFNNFLPTIDDYLARADTNKKCEEVIEYCLHQKEISEEEAEKYRYRLKRGGPQAFGTRDAGYYDSKL